MKKRKRACRWFFLGFFLMLFSLTGGVLAAADSSETVKIGYYQSRNFQEGDGEKTLRSGYGYEYIQKIAAYTGWQYEYIEGTWDDLYQKLTEGEIDLMAGISYKEDREKEICYPDYEMLEETFYIYKDSDDASIKSGDMASFSGKKIGTVAEGKMASFLEAWISENQVDVKPVFYEDIKACAEDFNEGKLDGFVGADNQVFSYSGITPVEIIGKEPYYLAVSRKRKDLLGELNMALSVMTSQDAFYLETLQNKYSADTSVSVFLSRQELDWMEAHPAVTVGYVANYLPYSDIGTDGVPVGMVADLVADLFQALPGSYRPEITYRCYETVTDLVDGLKSKEVDFAFPVSGETPYAEKMGYRQSSNVVNSAVDLVYTGIYRDSVTERIAVNQENQLQYYYTAANYPDAEIVFYDTIEECIQAVKKGEADSTIVNALRLVKLIGYDTELHALPLVNTEPLCIGVAFGESALLRLLNHGLSILGENYGVNHAYQYIGSIVTYTSSDFLREYRNVFYALAVILFLVVLLLAMMRYREVCRRSEKEAEQNRKLEEALRRARQANLTKQVFLNNMSHDIRTPLNGILGILEMNRKSSDPEVVAANRQKARRFVYQLLDMVNNVIEVCKLENGEISTEKSPVDLFRLTEELQEEEARKAKEAGLLFSRERKGRKEPWPMVEGNEVHIRQTLQHILENAMKYNKTGGKVFWQDELKEAGEKWVTYECSISDTGMGMQEEFLQHIFEPFAQEGSDARTSYKGLGLGMAIVKELVDGMGGTIEITSKPEEGTTVHLTLPFLTTTEKSLEEVFTEENEKTKEADLSGRKILLVEDNELNIEIARFMLEEAGAEVTEARDGQQAVNCYLEREAGAFDAVLMDLMMPVMNGFEASRQIRTAGRKDSRTIPIIATTAGVTREAREKSKEAGISEFLEKPLDMEKMLHLLEELIREKTT